VALWCIGAGGTLAGGFRHGRLEFALTTSPAFDASGLRAGDSRSRIGRRPKVSQRGGVAVLRTANRARALLIGVDAARVRWLAVAKPRLSARAIGAWVDATRG
jgi:hypothetical protein